MRHRNICPLKKILALTGIEFAGKKAGGIYDTQYIFTKLF
jgi:hypothetical protein